MTCSRRYRFNTVSEKLSQNSLCIRVTTRPGLCGKGKICEINPTQNAEMTTLLAFLGDHATFERIGGRSLSRNLGLAEEINVSTRRVV